MKWQGDEYEVIVLGSGLAGLVAGTFLSQRNRKVLLFREKKYHPSHSKDGYRFVPFSSFSEKRLKSSLLREISQSLDLSLFTENREGEGKTEKRPGRLKEDVAFQVILPKARIDLFSQLSKFEREWKREFPREVAHIVNFYNEIERVQHLLEKMITEEGPGSILPVRPRSLITRWFSYEPLPKGRMSEMLSPFSKEFREFIQLQLISRTSLFSDQFPIPAAAQVLFNDDVDEWGSGADVEKLREKIFERFFQSGGRMEEIEGVEKVAKKWKKGFAISLKGEQSVFRCKFLILDSPLHLLPNLLAKRGKRLSKWGEKIHPRYVLVPLFLGIREKVVPVGMKDLLVSIYDLGKPYERGNVLFIAISPRGDETQAPEGRRALTVESLMDFGEWDESSLVEHQKEVMKHLYHLFPFLDKYMEFTDWTWVTEQCRRWSYPHFLYEATPDFRWREGVVPTRVSRDLYFIGKENFPYLGLEGEVLSGRMVGQQILKKYS
jgi:phytoene dehydrogenase-like protein